MIHSRVRHDVSTSVPWLMRVCAMTSSYVCHESFTCVWLYLVCSTRSQWCLTHSYVYHEFFICAWMTHSCVCYDSLMCVLWLIHMCVNVSFICVLWRIHMFARTHPYMLDITQSARSNHNGTWLVHMCAISPSHMCEWFVHMCTTWLSMPVTMPSVITMVLDPFICVPFSLNMCVNIPSMYIP